MKLKAFTLIELLVTLTILGILIAATSLYFSAAKANGRDARRLSDISLIAKAVDQSVTLTRGSYPKDVVDALAQSPVCAQSLYNSTNSNNLDLSTFPPTGATNPIPVDPLPAITTNTCTSFDTTADYGYLYQLSPDSNHPAPYYLSVGLENPSIQDASQFVTPSQIYSSDSNTTASGRFIYVLPGAILK